jgi:hypothetical protein
MSLSVLHSSKTNHLLMKGCAKDPVCDELRPCVEAVVYGQYWKHFSSAYHAKEACKQFSFINPNPGKQQTVHLHQSQS